MPVHITDPREVRFDMIKNQSFLGAARSTTAKRCAVSLEHKRCYEREDKDIERLNARR